MPRLIDAEKLWKAITTRIEEYCDITDLIEIIETQPTVDAVEVSRCKDCKYFGHQDFGKGEEYWCEHFIDTKDLDYCLKIDEDGFCSWGERR